MLHQIKPRGAIDSVIETLITVFRTHCLGLRLLTLAQQSRWVSGHGCGRAQLVSRVWLFVTLDCSPPGSSDHGISQARILGGDTIPFSKGSSWPRDWIRVSCITGQFFTVWAPREVLRVRGQMGLIVAVTSKKDNLARSFEDVEGTSQITFFSLLKNQSNFTRKSASWAHWVVGLYSRFTEQK